jgi:hypothetical protein
LETLKSFGVLIVKILFFIICIVVSLVCAVVSAYFSIRFYQYGTDKNETLYLLLAMLAICIEVIKYSMSLFYPILIGRDLVHEKLINSMLRLSLIMSILASLTFFLVSHSNFQPVNRIVDLLYNTFLTQIHLDYGRGIVAFVGNCVFSIIIEYFILLLPKVSTLPFRPKIENYKDVQYEKSTFGKITEMISVIPVYFIDKMYNRVMAKYKVVQLEANKIKEYDVHSNERTTNKLESNENQDKVLLEKSKDEDDFKLLSENLESKPDDEEKLGEDEEREFFDSISEREDEIGDFSENNDKRDNVMDFSKKKKLNVNFNLHDNKNQDENTFISKYIEKYKNQDKDEISTNNEIFNEEVEEEEENIEEIMEAEKDVYEIGNYKRNEINDRQSSNNFRSVDELGKVRSERSRQNNIYTLENSKDFEEETYEEESEDEQLQDQDNTGIKKKLGEKLPFNIENVKKYFDYLQENSRDDIAVGYKKVADNTGLTQGEALRIFNQLRDKGYLRTENRKTKIKKRKLNAFDFITE